MRPGLARRGVPPSRSRVLQRLQHAEDEVLVQRLQHAVGLVVDGEAVVGLRERRHHGQLEERGRGGGIDPGQHPRQRLGGEPGPQGIRVRGTRASATTPPARRRRTPPVVMEAVPPSLSGDAATGGSRTQLAATAPAPSTASAS
jgi:hypothetical protein